MATVTADPPQGDGSSPPASSLTPDQVTSRAGNMVYKSGLLSLSSKGIGWTSWKKRWFILTRTSLVFFKNDPSVPSRGGEVNLTLGGIDLNNSGSVVVKEDKKLLTVLFPDGRDGRTFTLKAETLEDLYEWKNALEDALAQAPSATLVLGQNGIFKNEQIDADVSLEQENDGQSVKPLVTGRPILLALEDSDGTPSFLEKALRFIEEHGVKVEGILRQAADVDDVELRVREYEQGKNDFSPEEDPHVVGDCIKHVLRELPSSPVPASCCKALLEACRTDRSARVAAMRAAICESFPEPNRRLLQRVLMMMQSVASHKAENRMSSSAVAACMAPLLLRPLLAGDCELENDFDVGGDGSIQLLQAAAAANHAQTIVITLLEEYTKIFGEGSISSDLYSDSDMSQSESEEALTEDDYGEEEEYECDEESFDDEEQSSEENFEGDEPDKTANDFVFEAGMEHASNGSLIESGEGEECLQNHTGHESSRSCLDRPEVSNEHEMQKVASPSSPHNSSPPHEKIDLSMRQRSTDEAVNKEDELPARTPTEEILSSNLGSQSPLLMKKSSSISNAPISNVRCHEAWSRAPAQKKLSMDSLDNSLDDEMEIQRLEELKVDLKSRIAEEAERNIVLQETLLTRKMELRDRRLALENDVVRLQEELQQERGLRVSLEAGLKLSEGPLPFPVTIDEKIKADLEEVSQTGEDVINLKKKFDELELQLNQQREQKHSHAGETRSEPQKPLNQRSKLWNNKKDTETSVPQPEPEKAAKNKAQKYHPVDGLEDRSEKVQDARNSQNKHPTQDQHSSSRSSNFKLPGFSAVSASEPAGGKAASSKKTWGKNEAQKDPLIEASEDRREKGHDAKNSPNKHPAPDQHSRSNNFKLPGFSVTPLSDPPGTRTSNSKKTWGKSEATNPSNPSASAVGAPTSVFSKFTTRFYFLNERRTQIANEIQNMDKGRGLGQAAHNTDKNRQPQSTLECPYDPNTDKTRSRTAVETKSEAEGGSTRSPEKHKKSDSGTFARAPDKSRRSDASGGHNLERGRSEGQHFWDGEMGQGFEGQVPPRTNSR